MNIREQCNSISKLIFAGRWSLTEFNGCQRNIIQCCIQNACHATSSHLYHVYNLIKWQLWLDVVKQNITTEIPEQLSDRACNTMLNLSTKTVNVTFKSMLKRMKPIVTSNENVAEYYFFSFQLDKKPISTLCYSFISPESITAAAMFSDILRVKEMQHWKELQHCVQLNTTM